jgi:hypothetical protein
LLEKAPVVPLSVVFVERAIVGDGEVLHTIPRAVTVAPPSEVTLPPLVAAKKEILEADVVVMVGADASDVMVINPLDELTPAAFVWLIPLFMEPPPPPPAKPLPPPPPPE